MLFGKLMRAAGILSLFAVAFSAIAEAQQPDNGGQPPQQSGRGGQGGRGGFGGGAGGRGGFGFGGPGGGMMGGRVDRAMLLGIDQIRTELKIEESQAAVIDAALEAYREERSSAPRPDRDAFQTMSDEERTKVFADMQKQREELSKKTDEVLNALLEVPQKERLDQITLQMRLNVAAAQTLKSDDIKEKLKISEEQVTRLDAAETASQEDMRKMMEEMRASFQGGNAPGAPGAGFEGMREKMEAARSKSTEAVMAVLNDSQKAELETMKGAKFEVDMRALMGGRGGFGGPGGPGGQGGGRGAQGGGRGGRGTRPPAE